MPILLMCAFSVGEKPLELRLDGGELVHLGRFRQRALLVVLALHANEVVSTNRLYDLLWFLHPPAKTPAAHLVQISISRLRRALGPASNRLVTRPPGYVLEVGLDEIDAGRCEPLYESALASLAAGEAAEAAEPLREAEALWRGPPLAEFTYEGFAQETIGRLEWRRFVAVGAEPAGVRER